MWNTYSSGFVIPNGIHNLKQNGAWITLGTSKGTSKFCCDCLIDGWNTYGKLNYPFAISILILADGGGSNSSRHYIFKAELQKLANAIDVEIRIAH